MAVRTDVGHRMVLRHHSTIGHLFVPKQRARLVNESGGYWITTNSSGFRSDWEFAPRRGDRPRILLFGDSTLAGDNGSNADRYSDRLGERLGAETYNFGLSGSGTDQHLLLFREFAKEIEADLIVLAVQVDAIRRVQASERESIDRQTRSRVMVPKPFFTLEDGGLRLHNVPVPKTRPPADGNGSRPARRGVRGTLQRMALDPRLQPIRTMLRERAPRAQAEMYRLAGFQPYPEYDSDTITGWRLLEALIRQFLADAAPVPVVVAAIPTPEYFQFGAAPNYLPLFARFDAPSRGVHVVDVTTPLNALPWNDRRSLTYRRDVHFSPAGHEKLSEILANAIIDRGLLPRRAAAAPPGPRATAAAKRVHVLGVSCFYHNSAACLVTDGRIVAAAEEERFTRIKNDRRFPDCAVNYCLEAGGIDPGDLAAVVFYDNAGRTFERLLHGCAVRAETAEDIWCSAMPSWLRQKLLWPRVFRDRLGYSGLVLQEDHHRSHAASAFFPSPFERAAVLTIDGVGEWATASIGVGRGRDLKLLREMRFPHSLGLLYSAFTQFTGFKVNSGEYKMMGLASYGEPRFTRAILDHVVDLKSDGSVVLNLDYFGFLDRTSMVNEHFSGLFGGPARRPEDRITRREIDLARSIQDVTEEAMLRMARHAKDITGEANLCLAGGVALNCVGNGRVLREGPFERLWIQPAAGDSGGAAGAALDVYHTYFGHARSVSGDRSAQGASYLGPSFSNAEIGAFLDTFDIPHRRLTPEDRADAVAALIEDGKAVGHFDDRMEFGPRALGARSILGDARNSDMQAKLNLKIKYRESFRPFAPSVLRERAAAYFDLQAESPHMLLVAPVRADIRKPRLVTEGDDLLAIVRDPRSTLPAITHVDYSARIQTVSRDDAPRYWDVIHAFEKRTGTAVIVNTSFNVRGEPIVCTPYDAWRCFMQTEMDALVLGDYLLLKSDQPASGGDRGAVENDDVETAPAGPVDRRLDRVLRGLYRDAFRPTAMKLRESGHLALCRAASASSTWVESSANVGDSVFRVPAAFDSAGASPDRLADALAAEWQPGPARDALRPLLQRLFETGLQRSGSTGDTDEAPEVSHSVYVMF
jgi:carbamoyltransferase